MTETLQRTPIDVQPLHDGIVEIAASTEHMRVLAGIGYTGVILSCQKGADFYDTLEKATMWGKVHRPYVNAMAAEETQTTVTLAPKDVDYLRDCIKNTFNPAAERPREYYATYAEMFDGLQPVAEALEAAAQLQKPQ